MIFITYITDRGFESRIYKEFLQIHEKRTKGKY